MPPPTPVKSPMKRNPLVFARRFDVYRLAVVLFLVLLGFGLSPTLVGAHGRSVSYSTWDLDSNGATVSVRLKLLELSRLGPQGLPPGSNSLAGPPGTPDLPARAFPTELVLVADGVPCDADPVAQRRPDEPGWVQYQWQVRCPENTMRLSIHSQILLAVAPSHMHFARARFEGLSGGVREQVLTEASPEFVVRQILSGESQATAPGGSRFVDYFVLGVEHILSGWDHLAFVLGLLMLAGRIREVARLITGFTLAHSLTLGLAVLQLVHPRAAAVEAVIAFSVALVAIERGWLNAGRPHAIPAAVVLGLCALAAASFAGLSSLPVMTIMGLILFTTCYFALIWRSHHGWLRACLTFAFGLVHGFGFAGVLVEMTLPADRLVPALLGFNLGVETGQVAVVLILWPILASARRWANPKLTRWAGDLSTAALCGIGLYWLLERAFQL